MEANENIWITYHKDPAAKLEKFNNNCQQWALEMNTQEAKASTDQEKVKKDI
jgi:hypothetical protein